MAKFGQYKLISYVCSANCKVNESEKLYFKNYIFSDITFTTHEIVFRHDKEKNILPYWLELTTGLSYFL